MHHTGSQENEVGPEEQEETQEQEPLGGPEPGEELQECPDHRPSTFEKGKPRSFLSLPILANISDILCLFYYVALSDRNYLIPLMHMHSLISPLVTYLVLCR